MFGAAKAECNPPPAGTVQLHPALIIIIITPIRQSVGQPVCVSLCTLVWEGLCMLASRAAVCLCARAMGATGQQARPSAVQQVCVCADAAEWRAVLLGAELPVSSRCHSAAAASSRHHICSSCFDVTAAGDDACSHAGSWAAAWLEPLPCACTPAPVNSNSTCPGWHPTNTCGVGLLRICPVIP